MCIGGLVKSGKIPNWIIKLPVKTHLSLVTWLESMSPKPVVTLGCLALTPLFRSPWLLSVLSLKLLQ